GGGRGPPPVRVVAWVEAHPYFALREIDVEAHGALDAKTLLAWAGLALGASAWSVHEADAERRLLAHSRIREAHVERTLPAQVRIRVEERSPVAILLADRPLLVAQDGEVFPPVEGEALDGLPYITGLAGKPPTSATIAKRLRIAAGLAELWRQHAPWAAISEIRPDGDDLVAFVSGMPLAVRFSSQACADDFARLSAVLGLWRGREAQLAAIDLSLPGEAVLKLRRASARRANRAAI
ncbi:MAG: FtsQ-type POTRA domain-containing protein, partial [Candidatus Binatia bacterium]